jgi:hypothetical protein
MWIPGYETRANYPLSNNIPVALGREVAIYAPLDGAQRVGMPPARYDDIYSIQLMVRPNLDVSAYPGLTNGIPFGDVVNLPEMLKAKVNNA